MMASTYFQVLFHKRCLDRDKKLYPNRSVIEVLRGHHGLIKALILPQIIRTHTTKLLKLWYLGCHLSIDIQAHGVDTDPEKLEGPTPNYLLLAVTFAFSKN